jgi:hypothetical protein
VATSTDEVLADFPALATDRWSITSEATDQYNCVAWAAQETRRWWWPSESDDDYWPLATREETPEAFKRAFAMKRGYEGCDGAELELGWEKIVLYVLDGKPTHMARQLADGSWTSKLGPGRDIMHHTLAALEGPMYGAARHFMKRRRDGGHNQA